MSADDLQQWAIWIASAVANVVAVYLSIKARRTGRLMSEFNDPVFTTYATDSARQSKWELMKVIELRIACALLAWVVAGVLLVAALLANMADWKPI